LRREEREDWEEDNRRRGNRPVLKDKVSVVMEQFLCLLHTCGMPRRDVDFINCSPDTMERFLRLGDPRTTLFTGSSRVAERLRLEGG
jgi:1-pyrroline-5-carboxylate dehydrogenase